VSKPHFEALEGLFCHPGRQKVREAVVWADARLADAIASMVDWCMVERGRRWMRS
jgi:hypothetical protein